MLLSVREARATPFWMLLANVFFIYSRELQLWDQKKKEEEKKKKAKTSPAKLRAQKGESGTPSATQARSGVILIHSPVDRCD